MLEKEPREFISIEAPKGTKQKIRLFAAKNGYKSVSEVVRAAVDTLMSQNRKEEAILSEIEGD